MNRLPKLNSLFLSPLCLAIVVAQMGFSVAKEPKSILFLAGKPSHGYGAHEHLAGCRILAAAIEESAQGVECRVVSGGWPEEDSVLDSADTIVMYCDGGKRHPAIAHLESLKKQMDRGAGFVCIHYAVEVPIDQGGEEFLQWLGGYFETNWSVNPHWVASYESLPNHPVAAGVSSFKADDEWYFHMRFRPEMEGVTPILSAIAPAETMRRKDGAHSGNPHVRKAVANGEPQHTAWIYERSNGGRSFGFTGGHYHWNWGKEEILKLVANAIVWSAKAEVPEEGLAVIRPTQRDLEAGQDEAISKKYDAVATQKKFDLLTK